MPYIEDFDLRGNRMGERGVISILRNVNPSRIKTLNLSSNNLSRNSMVLLAEMLGADHCSLGCLTLERTRIDL